VKTLGRGESRVHIKKKREYAKNEIEENSLGHHVGRGKKEKKREVSTKSYHWPPPLELKPQKVENTTL
jgi:hypothetical protein